MVKSLPGSRLRRQDLAVTRSGMIAARETQGLSSSPKPNAVLHFSKLYDLSFLQTTMVLDETICIELAEEALFKRAIPPGLGLRAVRGVQIEALRGPADNRVQ